jgi:PAS domain-containing protein
VISRYAGFNISDNLVVRMGKPIRLIITLADVTERKEAEKEIRESEERLRIINDNLENLVINELSRSGSIRKH